MTIPMDNTSGSLSRDRAQLLYNKTVELENKRRKAAQARIPSDPNAWQQIRENYESILIEDHTFSEQHDIEYALWQLHYRRIEEFRALYNAALASATQNGKGSARPGPDRITKIRSQFKTFLSEATGFYHDLMVKIRAKHGLSMGYLSDDPENEIALSKDGSKYVDAKKGLISCHRCFIYLGDLARYKGLYGEGDSKARDFAAASSYYTQASALWPSSGNPHHQLAILASYMGDELLSVYRYFRSLAVENPFSTARDNLIIAFEKNRQSYSQLLGDSKAATPKKAPARMTGKGRGKGEPRPPLKDRKVESGLTEERASSVTETFKGFCIRFVRLNGILFTRTSLETFGDVFATARNDLLRLLSSGPNEVFTFGSDAAECEIVIIRMITILIFTVHYVNKETGNQSYAEILQRSVVLQNAFTAIFEFMAHILDRCFQLNNLSTSFLLPGIMVFVEWLACRQDIAFSRELEEKPLSARSLFWKHCVCFLNKLLLSGSDTVNGNKDETCFFNMSRYDEGETANRLALPEDMELRGFFPLHPAQLILDFSRKHYFGGDGGKKETKARIVRIIAAGKALANAVLDGQRGIYFDKRSNEFVFGMKPQVSDDYSPSHSVEILANCSMDLENLQESETLPFGDIQPQEQSYVDEEDEDEVIVFKPSVIEKHANGIPLGLSSSEVIRHDINSVNVGSNISSVSMTNYGFVSGPPTSFAHMTSHHQQPVLPTSFANMNMVGTDSPPKPAFEEHFGVMQPAAFSVPTPQSLHLGVNNGCSAQLPETSVPSKFDSIISLGTGMDSLSMKPTSIKSSVGSKRSPVSRPIRHAGPPPGFSSLPKLVDRLPSTSSANSINGNPTLDDYRWLDGYQFPSSAHGNGFTNLIDQLVQPYNSLNKSSTSVDMVSFPFPGKQVSAVQLQTENHNGWFDYQFPEHLKLYQQQQKLAIMSQASICSKSKDRKEQSMVLPQYQGHSLWEGRFFV